MRSFEVDEDEPLDVHSFRALERLQVHIDRQESDRWSIVVAKGKPYSINLILVRSQSDVWARKGNAA